MNITSHIRKFIKDKLFPSIKLHEGKIAELEILCKNLIIDNRHYEQQLSKLSQESVSDKKQLSESMQQIFDFEEKLFNSTKKINNLEQLFSTLIEKMNHFEEQSIDSKHEIIQFNQYVNELKTQLLRIDVNIQQQVPELSNKIFNLIPQNELSILKKAWWYHGGKYSLLNILHRDMYSPYCWETYDTDYWLISIAILIDLDDSQVASRLSELYLKYHGLKRIDNYLNVSNFFHGKGWINQSIEKAKTVYDALTLNNFNKVIENFFSGKSIAIVGNGPSEIGKNRGGEIDSHDVVIRFNNFKTDGFEIDYGKKTTVWIRGSGADDVIDRDYIDDFDLVIWEADYNHFAIYYDHLDILYRDILKAPNKICNFDFETHHKLREESKIDFPSTGLVAIWAASQFSGTNNISIYGFSALEPESDFINIHYFNDRPLDESINRTVAHNMKNESVFIKKILKID